MGARAWCGPTTRNGSSPTCNPVAPPTLGWTSSTPGGAPTRNQPGAAPASRGKHTPTRAQYGVPSRRVAQTFARVILAVGNFTDIPRRTTGPRHRGPLRHRRRWDSVPGQQCGQTATFGTAKTGAHLTSSTSWPASSWAARIRAPTSPRRPAAGNAKISVDAEWSSVYVGGGDFDGAAHQHIESR